MSRLTELLRVAKQLDPQLGTDLENEVLPLQKRLPFGLNFERHAPEAVELAGHPIRKGSKVRVLPPRGELSRGDQRLWLVDAVEGTTARLSLLDSADQESASTHVDDLVLVAEFRDRIYPGLRADGSVDRGGPKPYQTVINGENFHVLELLTFTHSNAVDAIYIDPPYNSGARDWKYNNDYVEGDDLYRHSKWLAFMERRLKVAKQLLKPENSVLIVTIDEKEYLRLGLLLEQTFPEARVQMVSIAINGAVVSRGNSFGRSDEYAYFVYLGDAAPVPQSLGADWTNRKGVTHLGEIRWDRLIRSGTGTARSDSPGGFYPVYVDPDGPRIRLVGEPLPAGVSEPPSIDGCVAVLPMRSNGSEGRWQMSAPELRKRLEDGRVRVGGNQRRGFTLYYLKDGEYKKVVNGTYKVTGYRPDGSVITDTIEGHTTLSVPGTQWRVDAHDASHYGSRLLLKFLPDRKFPFPKSLYAVEDVLRFFLSDKPNAVVVDFFAGSGTTAHAVMRLNHYDDGQRQAIMVTNNEVSAEEQRDLRARGLRPGDEDWEALGICEAITKPRVRAAITGVASSGEPVKGDYTFNEVFPMAEGFDENAAFFTLTYESPWRVSTDRAFAAIAPMLWLRAGAEGARIDALDDGWKVADTYGVIKDLDRASDFVDALVSAPKARIAYIVTDDEGRYQQIADEIPGVETVRLYEDYLRNCESNVDA